MYLILDTTASSSTVTIAPVNDAPVVNTPATFSMQEDGSLVISTSALLAGVSDVDNPASQLSITNVQLTNPAQGTLVTNPNGNWTFLPAANLNGTVGFSYTVSDGIATTTQTSTISIDAVNDAPIVNSISFSGTEDTAITFTRAQLLGSSYDVEGSALTIVGNTVTSNHGTVTYNSGADTWTFTPAANYNGPATLNYSLSDGSLTTASNTIINIAAVNDVPVANAVSLNMYANDAIVITSAQLLANTTDADGDTLSITNVTSSQGILVNNGNNTWTFSPAANFTGTTDLTFTVSDGTTTVSKAAHINVAQNTDLHFSVNSQNTEYPDYSTPDNLSVAQPANFNQNYSATGSDGTEGVSNYSAANNGTISLSQEAASGVSNVEARSSSNATVTVNNFDRTDVELGNGGNSSVTVNNTTEGDINTGSGNDTIYVDTATTADNDGNLVNINSGDGADNITFNGDNTSTMLNVNGGAGNDTISLQGKYGSSNIYGGAGDDTVTGSSQGNDTYHFSEGQGNDTFNGGGGTGWADSIMIDSTSSVTITANTGNSWTLVIDGQEATLTADTAGTVVDNHLDFSNNANGTLTMADGSTLNFNNINHVEW